MGDLAKGTLIALVLLLMVELLIRAAWGTLPESWRSDPELDSNLWFEFSGDMGWIRRPNFAGSADGTVRRFDRHGLFESDARKLALPLPRVILLGDSSTFGYRVQLEDCVSEQLDTLLPGAVVINLGVIGYSSDQVARSLLREALPLDPALVIVASNFNDRRYVMNAAEVDGAAKYRQVARGHDVRALLARSYLFRAMRLAFLLAKTRVPPESVDLRELPLRVSPERYRENLERIADAAQERHVRLLFLVLRDNPLQKAYLDQGLRLEAAGLIRPAEEKLDLAVRLDDNFSDLARIALARVYARDPDPARRARAGEIARAVPYRSLHGGNPARTDQEYIDIMEEVGRRRGIPVVDPRPVLARDGSDYLDFVHPNREGHAKLAALLAEAIRKEQLLPEGKGTAARVGE